MTRVGTITQIYRIANKNLPLFIIQPIKSKSDKKFSPSSVLTYEFDNDLFSELFH